MGCCHSKKPKKVEPEYKCKILANNLDDSSRGIYLGKLTNHPIYLAENCIDGDKKNKQLEELRRIKGKIVACGFLHDGSALLADEIRKILLLLQKDRDASNFLILKAEPVGIAVLGIDVFVSLADKRVQHATVVNDKIVHQATFKTNQPCLGIASFNGDIAVGFKNGEVHILDRKFQKHCGFFLPKFEDGRLLSPTSMIQFKQTLLVTDCYAHAVVRVTLKGEPLFVYTGMTSPRCTVIDNSGNIILAGYDDLTGEKIQHLSPRGEKIPSRMSTTDVAQFPYCIAFFRKYSKLLIAGDSDRYEAAVLQVTEPLNVQVEPETSHLVDATTDTVSESMSLVDIENLLKLETERLGYETIGKTTKSDDGKAVFTEEKKQSKVDENVLFTEEGTQSKVENDKLTLEDLEKQLKADDNNERIIGTTSTVTSVADIDKAPTPVDVTLPNEVPDNTAVTVYDKTNKGIVKKVLITVREKKPQTSIDNGPKTRASVDNGSVTVYEKKAVEDLEEGQKKSTYNQTADKTSSHGSRPVSPIYA